MQEDRVSLNAVEHVARAANDRIQSVSRKANSDSSQAATNTAILTFVDVSSRAALEESHETRRTRTINEKKKGRKRLLLADSLVISTIIRTHTRLSRTGKSTCWPGGVHLTDPLRESLLSAMYNDPLDLLSREVEA